MTRTDKGLLVEELKEKFENSSYFYVTDASTLTVAKINQLRRICFEKGVEVNLKLLRDRVLYFFHRMENYLLLL